MLRFSNSFHWTNREYFFDRRNSLNGRSFNELFLDLQIQNEKKILELFLIGDLLFPFGLVEIFGRGDRHNFCSCFLV